MHSGTTSDLFLRDNLEWLGMASNWSKFSATAALGVIHKGYFEEGMTILGPYLPQAGGDSSMQGAAYSEGGALYALGLINAGCGSGRSVEGYLRETLRAAQGEVVQHGAALGLGVAGMGGKNPEAYDDLKQTLFTDSAVAGEAAGYAMGLIMLGTADANSADEMLTYARETQHEKIIRGLAVGVGFIYYGRQEEADATIKLLLAEKVCPSFVFFYLHLLASCRIPSFGTEGCIHWPWHMPEPRIMMQFDDSCTLLSPILLMMSGEQP
jgi:26S proteasome regulatory subunit N2